MDKDSKVTRVEVVDKDNNVLISMNYQKIEYNKKFDDDYFDLKSIIKSDLENESKKTEDKEVEFNNTSDKDVTNKESGNNTNNDSTTNNNGDNSNNNTFNSNNNSNSSLDKDSKLDDNSTEEDNKDETTEETLSIDDVIYPMYLPDNTYLTSQERIDTDNGERLILTFGGDNSFVLVEETIASDDNNVVIPVSGEFDFLSDVIGIIGTNSVMWHSNGIEYYMTSDTLETSVLVDIARSISILPVSK